MYQCNVLQQMCVAIVRCVLLLSYTYRRNVFYMCKCDIFTSLNILTDICNVFTFLNIHHLHMKIYVMYLHYNSVMYSQYVTYFIRVYVMWSHYIIYITYTVRHVFYSNTLQKLTFCNVFTVRNVFHVCICNVFTFLHIHHLHVYV